MNDPWITCTVNRRRLTTWLVTAVIVSLVLAIALSALDSAAGIFVTFTMMILIAVVGLMLGRARFRYDNVRVQSRYILNVEREWNDAVAWSYLGSADSLNVYIRFSDGTTIGSNQWLLDRNELIKLISVLLTKVGDPQYGSSMVLPWPYRMLRPTEQAG